MSPLPSVVVLCSLTLLGCNGATRPVQPEAPTAKRADQKASLYLEPEETLAAQFDLGELRFVGMDDGPVPDFTLRTESGGTFESRQLVGERAFIVVFFATWCAVCDLKLPVLRRALAATAPVTAVAVAVDDAPTWPRVAQYMKKHGLTSMPLVRAQKYPGFAISYNPFGTVPLVVVVGQNGGLVDYQIGYAPNDEARLEQAVRLAKRIGPLKSQH